MSVIYGLLNFNSKVIDNSDLLSMEKVLNHWDADDKGQWLNKHACLGHLMLYNTPESLNEILPLYHAESKLTITADARIDNRSQLLDLLDIPLVNKHPVSDSFLILKAYEKYGEDCVKYLIGDFAFAIWDELQQKLFCARDQMGVKPFFYYLDKNVFAFASEKKGILCLNQVDAAIDEQYMYNQMQIQPQQFLDETLYVNIKRIIPAYCIRVDYKQTKLTTWQYWEPDTQKKCKLSSREEYFEQLRIHFEEAVRCRLRSAYPIGAELSGGIDSSAIVGVANKMLRVGGKGISTFSHVLPPGTDEQFHYMDEKLAIEEIVKFNGLNDHTYISDNGFKDFKEEADFSLKADDGPEIWDSTWLTATKRVARQRNIRTILSGFLGDEIFKNNRNLIFLDMLYEKQYLSYFFSTGPGWRQRINFILPYRLTRLLHKIRNTLGVYNDAINVADQVFNVPNKYKNRINDPLWLNPYYKTRFRNARSYQVWRIFNSLAYARIESETRLGLNFKTETRFPMADIRLIEFYLSVPTYLKCEGNIKRYAFRKSLEDYFPLNLSSLDYKSAFTVPFKNLLFPQMFKEALDILENVKANPLINKRLDIRSLDPSNTTEYNTKEFFIRAKLNFLRWVEKSKKE